MKNSSSLFLAHNIKFHERILWRHASEVEIRGSTLVITKEIIRRDLNLPIMGSRFIPRIRGREGVAPAFRVRKVPQLIDFFFYVFNDSSLEIRWCFWRESPSRMRLSLKSGHEKLLLAIFVDFFDKRPTHMTKIFAHTYFSWYEILSWSFDFMHCNRELAVHRSRYVDWIRM